MNSVEKNCKLDVLNYHSVISHDDRVYKLFGYNITISQILMWLLILNVSPSYLEYHNIINEILYPFYYTI